MSEIVERDNSDMYAGMAKAAREEGLDDIADWFDALVKSERRKADAALEASRQRKE